MLKRFIPCDNTRDLIGAFLILVSPAFLLILEVFK